ncbi:hypothetical protein T4A_3042 [Trichinella pseudospiralis]|uniref:Uncharacterized protein n=1 Tax=Trichinella pseudospiralis TaxID=6337 RepID=A0A0V1DP04_TRIPS|nr:hypothetical protein T4A_3042 [Trichinella pseudospiralis]
MKTATPPPTEAIDLKRGRPPGTSCGTLRRRKNIEP